MQSAEDDWRVSKPEEGSRRVWSYGKTTEAINLGTTFLIPFEIQPFMLKTMGQVNLFSWRWRLNQMVSNVFAHSMKKTSCREWPVQGLVGMINPFISKRPLNAPRNIMHSILTTSHRPLPSTGPLQITKVSVPDLWDEIIIPAPHCVVPHCPNTG